MQKRSFARATAGAVCSCLVALALPAGDAVAQNHMSYKTTAAGTERTLSKTDIEASPDAVFAVVDDLHAWSKWAWPDEVKRTYSGPARGEGAIYEWESAGASGSGRAQIVESSAPGRVVVDLDLKTPVAGHLTWVFAIRRVGNATTVAISTSGPSKLVASSYDTILGQSPSLIRLGCVAGGEPYKKWCEVFMIKIPAIRKERAAKH